VGPALRSAAAFAVKDLLQTKRESRTWYTLLLAFASMATFALLASGPRRRLVALQLIYLSPAMVVGTLFTRCIEDEVRVFLLLRQVFSSTRAFLRVKLLVMVGLSLAIVWTTAALVTAWALQPEAAMLPGRMMIIAAGTTLQCGACLGLAASFARLDEPQTTRNAAAPMWVHGGYWISVVPIVALQWLLDWWLVAAKTDSLNVTGSILAVATLLLGGTIVVAVVLLLATGARRLNGIE
jgi:hypothetical protein